MVSSQHACFEGRVMGGAAGILARGAPAVLAAEALFAVWSEAIANQVGAVAVAASQCQSNHKKQPTTTTTVRPLPTQILIGAGRP